MEFSQFYSKWTTITPKQMIGAYVQELDNDEIISSNQDSLEMGVRPDGAMMPEYTSFTVSTKIEKGTFISPSGRIALKDEGDFYNSMKVNKSEMAAEITATDSKTGKLVDTYGDEILDITDSYIPGIMQEARPRFISWLKGQLGLK